MPMHMAFRSSADMACIRRFRAMVRCVPSRLVILVTLRNVVAYRLLWLKSGPALCISRRGISVRRWCRWADTDGTDHAYCPGYRGYVAYYGYCAAADGYR